MCYSLLSQTRDAPAYWPLFQLLFLALLYHPTFLVIISSSTSHFSSFSWRAKDQAQLPIVFYNIPCRLDSMWILIVGEWITELGTTWRTECYFLRSDRNRGDLFFLNFYLKENFFVGSMSDLVRQILTLWILLLFCFVLLVLVFLMLLLLRVR